MKTFSFHHHNNKAFVRFFIAVCAIAPNIRLLRQNYLLRLIEKGIVDCFPIEERVIDKLQKYANSKDKNKEKGKKKVGVVMLEYTERERQGGCWDVDVLYNRNFSHCPHCKGFK